MVLKSGKLEVKSEMGGEGLLCVCTSACVRVCVRVCVCAHACMCERDHGVGRIFSQ